METKKFIGFRELQRWIVHGPIPKEGDLVRIQSFVPTIRLTGPSWTTGMDRYVNYEGRIGLVREREDGTFYFSIYGTRFTWWSEWVEIIG